MKRFLVLSSLLFTLTQARAPSRAFVRLGKSPALQIRGGAGPLDALTTAKAATVLVGAQGLVSEVAPGPAGEKYGYKDASPLLLWLGQNFGTGVVSFALLSYLLLFKDSSLRDAVWFANIPWFVDNLRNALNGNGRDVGFTKEGGDLFALAISVVVMWGCTQDWADTAIKVSSVFWGLTALYTILDPLASCKAWGYEGDVDIKEREVARNCGVVLLGKSATVASMAFKDCEPLKAVGYGYLVFALNLLFSVFVMKSPQEMELPMGPQYIWMLVHAVVAGTLLL